MLARHHINLQLAKVSTLGERVEDTFLVDGPALQHSRTQLQIESELLDAVTPAVSARDGREHARPSAAADVAGRFDA